MSYWLNDHELFLYTKGTGSDDVHLWRCKKPASSSSSSIVVPMKPDDFEYVETVTDYLELIGDLFDWDETDYKRLVKYILERRLLVNSQGFVIAELYKVDKDGNKLTDGANEEVPIYIRSLDVLPLKPYIPMLKERPIPLRTVKVLEDVNGKAALMEGGSQVTKLTARVENLEAENTRLESNNKTLKAENKTLDSNVKTLEAENKTLDSNVKTLEAENKTLDSNVKTLEGKVTKLTADLVTQMNALTTLQQDAIKEAWMNEVTNSEWVGIEELTSFGPHNITIDRPQGTFTVDETSTNVRARYIYSIKLNVGAYYFRAVSIEDLTNKEKARFLPNVWRCLKTEGKTLVCASWS